MRRGQFVGSLGDVAGVKEGMVFCHSAREETGGLGLGEQRGEGLQAIYLVFRQMCPALKIF